MNLLSDLSSELAEAILLGKQKTEKIDSKQAHELLGKMFEILQPIAIEEKDKNYVIQTESVKVANH
jgi:hypothetical protein